MADEANGHPELTLERLLPGVRIFRAFGASLDAKKLILGVLGLVLFHLGRGGIDRLFSREGPAAVPVLFATAEPARGLSEVLHSAAIRVAEPARVLVAPFVRVFAIGVGWKPFAHALLTAAWGTLVWGLVGGAIARIAVVQVARSERIGLGEALGFAFRKSLALVGTPLCPLLGVAFFATFGAAFGLLYRLGSFGATLAGIFAVFPLLSGLLMALIALVLATGWPLMHATVAAEAEDGFDALSRSFAYVNQRPGRYAALIALAWGVGILGLLVVDLFARTTVHMAHWSLSFGAPDDVLLGSFRPATAPGSVGGAAVAAHGFWLSVVALLAHGWIYGFFWTAATIIYLVLRHDVDGTPWHAIAAPQRRRFDLGPTTATADAPSPAAPEPSAARPAEAPQDV
jgi:hypothetical protein